MEAAALTDGAEERPARHDQVRETLAEQIGRKGARPVESMEDLRAAASGVIVVYDTNIASLAIKDRMPATLATRLLGAVEVLAFVTVGELVKWSHVRAWGERQRGALDAWLAERPVIDSTDEACRIWGRLAAEAHRRGTGVSANETWIAACCLSEGLPLVTRNVKDFVDFADHHGLVVISE